MVYRGRLLILVRRVELVVEFSCNRNCSSRPQGLIAMSSRSWHEQCKDWRSSNYVGGAPCRIGGGLTVKGLIALSCSCLHLSALHIHFNATSLVEAAGDPETSPLPMVEPWSDSRIVLLRALKNSHLGGSRLQLLCFCSKTSTVSAPNSCEGGGTVPWETPGSPKLRTKHKWGAPTVPLILHSDVSSGDILNTGNSLEGGWE